MVALVSVETVLLVLLVVLVAGLLRSHAEIMRRPRCGYYRRPSDADSHSFPGVGFLCTTTERAPTVM